MMEARNAAVDDGTDPAHIKIGHVESRLTPTKPPPVALPVHIPLGGELGTIVGFHITAHERSHFEQAFQDAPLTAHQPALNENYLIQDITSDAAVVVTASEAFSVVLKASFEICSCEGDPVHTFEPRQLKVKGVCNKPHAKPVTCKAGGELP
jgi:hypothetical protein